MEEKGFTLRLHGIEIVEKSYAIVEALPEDQEFKFDYNAKGSVDPERSLVVVFLELVLRKGDDPKVLAKLTTATAFEMPNIEQELPKQENGQYGIPLELDTLVKSVSISTARGILYSELRGTPLHKAYLPLIQLPIPQIVQQTEPKR